jgi:uncharacterized damage-inducible protein DinB
MPVVYSRLKMRRLARGQPLHWGSIQYSDFDKAQFKQPTWQMLLHVFNHGTYHRGQLVNMLRQLGVSRIPATDFALWSRGKK